MRDTNASFTNKHAPLVFAAVLALAVTAIGMYRVHDREREFNKTVQASKESEGYDRQLIDMVRRLEDELAERASFGYAGRKDPMSGTTRIVAERPAPQPGRTGTAPRRPAASQAQNVTAAARVTEEQDQIRLTAIIFDNSKKTYTAIVMEGSRSFSVAVGDRIAGLRITRISNEDIYMESDTERFVYNIMGESVRTRKH